MPKPRQKAERDPSKAVPAPAAYIRALLRRFAPDEATRTKLLAGTDIDQRRLADPAAEVTLFSFVSFSENLTRIVGPEWPLDALPAWSTAMQGALEVAVRSAPTVREGLETMARYGHVRGPYLGISIARERTKTKLSLTATVPIDGPTRRAMLETAALSAAAMTAQILEGGTGDLEFHFPWKAPAHAARLTAVFSSTVKFDQPTCALVVANALCDRPSPFADAALHASAVAELDEAARRIQSEDLLPLRVARLFKRRRTGRLSEEAAAKELGMSRRTLVRRLAAAGTTYRALLDTDLKQRAARLLEGGTLTRAEMAETLGFEDPTSFSRACRRWFKKKA